MKSIKDVINSNMPGIIKKLGLYINPLILMFKKENSRLLVFYFHGLYASDEEKQLNHVDPQNNMTVSQFEDFVVYFLTHKYVFISPEDMEKELDPHQAYAMLTFDDGYFNNMLACNILEKYRIPAVFFIATGNMNENSSFWWDIIYKYRTKQGLSLEEIRMEQLSLKSFKHQQIREYIINNFGIQSFVPWSDIDRPFSEAEVRELAKKPYIFIGNHTHSHSILTNYARNEISEEIKESNQILYDLTGSFPVSIAYPNGDYNDVVLDVTEEEGFRYAFTIEPKTNLIPVENRRLSTISRFMPNTEKIDRFGSFYRVGYIPDYFYLSIKRGLTSLIK